MGSGCQKVTWWQGAGVDEIRPEMLKALDIDGLS